MNEAAPAAPLPRRGWWTETYGLDVRSLALFRVSIALLLLGDLFRRSLDLRVFYTDRGVLPRTTLLSALPNPHHLSLYLANGSVAFTTALFLAAAVAAAALLVGFRTRAASVVSWLLLLSLHSRNPMVLDGGDALLLTFVFWGMFLPLGAVFSIDRALDPSPKPAPSRVFSAATVAFFLQVAFLYWFTAALKTGPEWRTDGSAVYYALRTPYFVQPFGRLLL
ncbi:MAG TPA: hypothetical protein VGR00_03310, partial [Thermoanaerobaculia bacterium]|nr:hypothetical protein [Thermoanaerobaculia bacterium]